MFQQFGRDFVEILRRYGGKALLLDSNDKAEADRRFDVVSKDELKASGGGQVLRRKGAA